jgi:hypothetical protein
MLCDFSISVLDHEGKEILDPDRKSPLPLLHWVKQIAGTQLEGDPTNVEHYRKMFKVYAKLEKAIDGKVELKTDTVVWLRERFVKAKIYPPVLFAFEKATEKPITDEELDGV